MQIGKWNALLLLLVAAGCGTFYVRPTESHALTPAQIADVENGVRVFARSVAQDVTRDGPAAWRRHFADLPQFFMAANGKMVFPDSATASMGIQDLASVIKKIELRWGDDLRVDPLTPELAMVAMPWREVRVDAAGKRAEDSGYFTGTVQMINGRWQFRNAHWSVPAPAENARASGSEPLR